VVVTAEVVIHSHTPVVVVQGAQGGHLQCPMALVAVALVACLQLLALLHTTLVAVAAVF
jgi:uncharacterized OsmC-like protein